MKSERTFQPATGTTQPDEGVDHVVTPRLDRVGPHPRTPVDPWFGMSLDDCPDVLTPAHVMAVLQISIATYRRRRDIDKGEFRLLPPTIPGFEGGKSSAPRFHREAVRAWLLREHRVVRAGAPRRYFGTAARHA